MSDQRTRKYVTASLSCLALLLPACSSNEEAGGGAMPAAAAASRRPAEGGGGAREAPTIALAASDVATVGRSTLEEATPITGTLDPIERVEVRARLEGDVTGVYVREGERVRAGQVLARFESSEQESAQRSDEAEVAAAEAELANARWNLEQSDELFKAGAIPERDLKAAQQAVAAAEATLAAARSQLRASSSSFRDTRVIAPISGVVETRTVEGGERVAAGSAMFSIVRNNVLELEAAVPARRASGVRVGQTVRFSADGREFDGEVARVSPTIDPSTRAITVYVRVSNADGTLRGGTFATGRVVGRTLKDVLVIPTAAVRQGAADGRPFVYRIQGDVLDVAPMALGVVDERSGTVEVRDGLEEGDRIVVGNVGTLGRGMRVEVLEREREPVSR